MEKINIYVCTFPLTFCHQVSDLVVYELDIDTHINSLIVLDKPTR